MTARHHVLFSSVAGLLAGCWTLAATPAVAVAAAVLAPRRAVAAGAVLAVLAGAGLAHARRDAIDHGRVPARIGAAIAGEVTLLERFRARASGERVAAARWRGGWADGERLLLRWAGAPVAGSGASADPPPGAVLAVRGRMSGLRPFEILQRRRGAIAAIDARVLRPTGARRGGLAGALDAARVRAEAGLRRALPAPEAALLRGMILGQDEAIGADVREDFQASGLAHILAVSGTNVMLLCTLVLAAGALLAAPLRARLGSALVLVALYVPLAGGGASIQRAGVMGAAGLVAALAGRATQRWYALGLAAAVTLALNPYAAAEPGWQLSFAAVAGLLALAPRLRERMRGRRIPVWLAEAGAMTVAATVATAPLLALHFDRVSIVSLLANLVAAPVVAPIMWLGMLAAAAGQLAPEAAIPFNVVNGSLVAFLAWLAHAAARVPLATLDLGAVPVLAGYAAAGLAWWQRRRPAAWRHRVLPPARPFPGNAVEIARAHPGPAAGIAAVLALVGLSVAGGGGPAPPRPGETVVSFLDVGQGDATLIQRDGASMLVDTGPPGGPVVQRLREAGVERLDVLLITHAQADHEGAAPQVVERFRPRVILNGGAGWPTRVQRLLAPAGGGRASTPVARVVAPVAGHTLRLGPLRVRILWPPRELMEAPPEGDANNRAVVAHLSAGDFDLLLPADAESPVTAPLDLPRVEALKVAHHGSDDPGLPRLLSRLRPQVAAIEVGRGNSYGHPTPATLAALEAVPRSYRTDRDGTVRLRVTRAGMRVESDGRWR